MGSTRHFAAAVILTGIIVSNCAGDTALSANSSCEDFGNTEQADQVRFVRAQLSETHEGRMPFSGDVDDAMAAVRNICASNPDRKLGTLPFRQMRVRGN